MSTPSFRIIHETRYRYTDRVVLEPHVFRLEPRPGACSVLSQSLLISPEPSRTSRVLDVDGNRATFAWFKGMSDHLDVRSEAVVQPETVNPFDFIVHPVSCARLPMVYPASHIAVLAPYVASEDIPAISLFASDAAAACQGDTVAFVMGLCRTVYEGFRYEKRDQGAAQSPSVTLQEKQGCCRDFSVLMMAACRRMGIAARYVSGYYLNDDASGPADLHAWVEVFLPGAGWKGFDPAQGGACDHRYIALSSSVDPLLTMPVTGTFRGGASCRISVNLTIDGL